MKRGKFKQAELQTTHWRFRCDSWVSIPRLRVTLEGKFEKQIDFIIEREPEQKAHCKSGYFRIHSFETSIGNIAIGNVLLRTFLIPEEDFSRVNRLRIPKIYFLGSGELTDEGSLLLFCSKFGQIDGLELTGFAHNNCGQLEVKGFVVYKTGVESERLLLSQSDLPSDFKVKDFKFVNATSLDAEIWPKQRKRRGQQVCISHRAEKLDMQPKLDFTKHKQGPKDHAFGGYYIRPYLKSAATIAQNSNDHLNIRLNILSPVQSRLERSGN